MAIVQRRPRLGGLGGRVEPYYLDNKEIRFPLSKLLVPRSLVYQEKLMPLSNEYYSHCVTYFSQDPTFVEVEVIFSDSFFVPECTHF